MDPTTASYFRSILFNDAASQEPLPKSLVIFHGFAFKRAQAMGYAIVPKMTALQIAMDWMFNTPDGRNFAESHPDLQGVFDEPEDNEPVPEEVSGMSEGAAVIVAAEDGTTKEGTFVRRKGGWVHVKHPGVRSPVSYRAKSVKLAGA